MMFRTDLLQQQEDEEEQDTLSATQVASVFASEYDDTTISLPSENNTDELGLYDVICGRHKAAFNNIGNRRFRLTISLAQERYLSASTRKEKSTVIKSIADLVRSNGGRFLQRKGLAWVELNEKHAHEKVGHALRDMAVAAATKSGVSGYPSQKASPKTIKPIFCSTKSDTAGLAASMTEARKTVHDAAAFAEAGACTEQDANQHPPNHVNQEVVITAEDTSMEPIALSQQQQHHRDSILDSSMMSWLSDESSSLLRIFER